MYSRWRCVNVWKLGCQFRQMTSLMPQRISQVVKPVAQSKGFTVRPFRLEDISEVMQIRRKIGVHDVSSSLLAWFSIDPEGIIVAENDSGEIIGTCSAVKQNDDLLFAGIFSILDEYRGYGIGEKLREATDEYIGDRNAALDAVAGITEYFRDRGNFPIVETEYKCIKNYTSVPVNPKHLSSRVPYGVTIEPFQRSHLLYIYDYDFDLMGFRREQALDLNCQEQDSQTLVAFKNGRCAGYGTIKTSCLGAGRVGPLYADDPEIAEVMLRRLILSLPKVTCFGMMTISTNIPAKRFLKKLDCPQMQELTRMYRKKKLSIDTSKVYALFDTNFAVF